MTSKIKESDILKSILQQLKFDMSCRVLFYMRTNAGTHKTDHGYITLAQPGTPDIIVILRDGRVVFIEVKRPGGKLGYEQKMFFKRMEGTGVKCVVLDDSNKLWGVLK